MHRRIAHISDPHILEPRKPDAQGFRTRFVSLWRPLDASERKRKLLGSLQAAKRSGAHHVVISGDLTETGAQAEFEQFAEVLDAAQVDPDSVTLVPGNHDAYSRADAWQSAIRGPLRAFAKSSAAEPGKVVDRGAVAFLPLDVTCYQSVARSGGEFTQEAAVSLEKRFGDPGLADKAVVVVQHHPPFGYNPVRHWIDGLRGHMRLMDLLVRFTRVQVLHGHMHRAIDRIIDLGKSRIFGAPAIVEDEESAPRVRLYDVRDGAIESAGILTG